MNQKQKELARHALGLPNKKKTSYRNHFNTDRDDKDWCEMVQQGDAVMRTSILLEDSVMFHLTLKGALAARKSDEHLSREDTEVMRKLASSVNPEKSC